MADMHTPLKELKSERIAMMMAPTELALIDNWRFENRIGSRSKAMRILIASALAPSHDAETVKALREQIATKDAALSEARTQVEILQDRLGIKDPGTGTLSIIDAALASVSASQKETV